MSVPGDPLAEARELAEARGRAVELAERRLANARADARSLAQANEKLNATLKNWKKMGLPKWAKKGAEGFLFPDTYELPNSPSADAVVSPWARATRQSRGETRSTISAMREVSPLRYAAIAAAVTVPKSRVGAFTARPGGLRRPPSALA